MNEAQPQSQSGKSHPQTRFPKIRRLILIAAITVPLLSFSAFLLYAAGFHDFGFAVAFLAFLVGISFPHQRYSDDETKTKFPRFGFWIYIFSASMVIWWLINIPGFWHWYDSIFRAQYLWDWRPITAAGLGHLYWIISGYQKSAALTDPQIFQLFESKNSRQQTRLLPRILFSHSSFFTLHFKSP